MAHVQIPDVAPKDSYTADGVQTIFTYTFPIFDEEDISVYVDTAEQTSGFTVTGVRETAGGTIVFDAAPDDGAVVTLLRERAVARTADFQTSGDLRAVTINDELDILTLSIQDVVYQQSYMIRGSQVDSDAGDFDLPAASARAGKFLGFDSTGGLIAGTVGLSQTVPPQFFIIDSAQTDYPLTLPADDEVTVDDLLIDISGWDLHSDPDGTPAFEVVNGDTVRLLMDLTERHGYRMQVRIISGAGIYGGVSDGAVNSPDKFANRPVDLAAMATGTALGVLGYDSGGSPAVITRKYIGEVWTWMGAKADLPVGNIVGEGQALSTVDFPDIFAVIGYAFGGSGGTFYMPDGRGRGPLYAGQGNTAEGGSVGTARLTGAVGGAEDHTLTGPQLATHYHTTGGQIGMSSGGSAVRAVGTTGSTTGNAGGDVAHNNMQPWVCLGYLAIYTGQTNHDYMGVLT